MGKCEVNEFTFKRKKNNSQSITSGTESISSNNGPANQMKTNKVPETRASHVVRHGVMTNMTRSKLVSKR